MYKLYYLEPFTGKQLLRAEFSTLKELKKAWLATENRDYVLRAVEEKPILNLPIRPRHLFQEYS